jgi:hypothetical protein
MTTTKLNIFQALLKVKDPRTKEGRRHNIAVVLLINIMAIMSGYTGIRSKQDFINRNKKELSKIFDTTLLKHGLPSKNTIDRIIQTIEFDDLNQALFQVFPTLAGTSIHLDGKAIRSTATLGQSSNQTFTSVVTAFANGKSIIARSFVNGSKNNEISTVQDLTQALGLEGMVLTLDALHCQKKL